MLTARRLKCTLPLPELYLAACAREATAPNAGALSCLRSAASAPTDGEPRAPTSRVWDVDLSSARVRGEQLETLLRFLGPAVCELRSLRLSKLFASAPQLELLASGLPSQTPLVNLDLSHQRLTPPALLCLLGLARRGACPLLCSLALSHNPIGDAVAAIDPLGRLRTSLRPGWNSCRLAAAVGGSTSARKLLDCGCRHVDALKRALADATQLKQLDLRSTRSTHVRRRAVDQLVLQPSHLYGWSGWRAASPAMGCSRVDDCYLFCSML